LWLVGSEPRLPSFGELVTERASGLGGGAQRQSPRTELDDRFPGRGSRIEDENGADARVERLSGPLESPLSLRVLIEVLENVSEVLYPGCAFVEVVSDCRMRSSPKTSAHVSSDLRMCPSAISRKCASMCNRRNSAAYSALPRGASASALYVSTIRSSCSPGDRPVAW
jgi:hypothetical protein